MARSLLLWFAVFAAPSLSLDNGLARTPPMGWMTWERYRCITDCSTSGPSQCINEQLIKDMADRLAQDGLLPTPRLLRVRCFCLNKHHTLRKLWDASCGCFSLEPCATAEAKAVLRYTDAFKCCDGSLARPAATVLHFIKLATPACPQDGWLEAGYKQVSIDDCWAMPDRDEKGQQVADPSRFPSGMAALGKYIHDHGLLFGTYSDIGSKTCAGKIGLQGHFEEDAASSAAGAESHRF